MMDKGDPRVRTIVGWKDLDKSKPLGVMQHKVIKYISDKDAPFQYHVQVVTRNKRSGQLIYRHITVSDSSRPAIEDILNDAGDVIMDSPTSKGEELVRAEVTGAFRYRA